MFDASDIEPRSPMDLPQSRCFFSTGQACMHTALWSGQRDVQLLLRSCPFGGISHAYADQNTFTLDAWGEPLIIASGYYPFYGHPHRVKWTVTTLASNSILVNGEGQPHPWNWDAKGEISNFVTTDGADYAVGDATRAYPGLLKRYLRKVLFVRPLQTGGPTLIAIHDDLLAEEPSSFQWLLHSLEKMNVDDQARRVTITRGESACRVSYLMPEGLTFSQTDQFTADPGPGYDKQWHLTASLDEKAAGRRSLIVIEPFRQARGERPLSVRRVEGEGCVAALLTDGDTRHLLLFATADEARVPAMNLVTDAEAAALTLRGDKVVSFFAAGASKLTVGETRLVQTGDRRDAVASIPKGEPLAGDVRPVFRVGEAPPAPMSVERFPQVRQIRCTAQVPRGGHYEFVLRGDASSGPPCPITITAGGDEMTWTPEAGRSDAELITDPIGLGTGSTIAVTLDGSTGGSWKLKEVLARRVYGRNLLPNPGFEDALADGTPALWRPGTITHGARCAIEVAPGGHSGERCLRVTCTEAGGDFGATLNWPGVPAVDYDRRFRIGVWVRNGGDSRVGIQVTNSDWTFHQTTGKPSDCTEWTETSSEFTLPAGENLAHLRLHMSADAEGAVMFADDAYLIELPPEEQ
ncbi:MAG: heparinase II/III family protein [Armatimonadetes bacterium]|nr:heparinase II/III family protein [Armatimonadota bacterium]